MLFRPTRSVLMALAVACLLLQTVTDTTAAGTTAAPRPPSLDPQVVSNSLPVVVTGLSHPVLVTHAGDGSGRLFVVEQTGRIRIIDGGTLLPTPFLDLRSSVLYGGERGLLGLAFHPSYETNGKFYVDFITKSGDTAINEYRVSSDPNVANRASGRRILTIDQPYANHNGGHLAFGPNGYLFIGIGDGGSGGDPGNRAQSVNSLLGKILRIDVNGTTGSRPYRIPSSNPYVGRAGFDEIYSRGLRNPWRFSFDRATADLWIGDVGQGRYEEIDRSTTSSGRGRGANYGWKVMEGRVASRHRAAAARAARSCRSWRTATRRATAPSSAAMSIAVRRRHRSSDATCSATTARVGSGRSLERRRRRPVVPCSSTRTSTSRRSGRTRPARSTSPTRPARSGGSSPHRASSLVRPGRAIHRSLTTQRIRATLIRPCRTVPGTDEGVASRP